MTSTSEALKSICRAARPLIADGLDIAEQIAALRETATNAGLDWSQIKALLKAQIQDERDDNGDGKRVKRLLEKADHATAYADLLGLANMNEKKYFAPPHDPETGEIHDTTSAAADDHTAVTVTAGDDAMAAAMTDDAPAALICETLPPDVPPEPAAGQVAETLPPVDVSATVYSPEDMDIPAFLRRAKPGGAPEDHILDNVDLGPMGASPEPHGVAA